MADLFLGMTEEERTRISGCLSSFTKRYKKDEIVQDLSFETNLACFLQKGSCELQKIDKNGNLSVLETFEEGDIFAKSLLFSDYSGFSIIISAKNSCEVVFIDEKKILTPCKNVCPCHMLLMERTVSSVLKRAERLSVRIDLLSKKNTREKLVEYFNFLSKDQGTREIQIPMSISSLADFLCVNRSAMTRELKKMKEEKIISMNKRLVILKEN